MTRSGTQTPPTLVSLLLCDQVIDDRLTNKKSAIGLFNTVVVADVPARFAQMTVMATLTEITARTTVELRFVRDADNHVLMATHGAVDAPDPLAIVELIFSLHGISLPTLGQYALELYAHGEFLGRRRFQVLKSPPEARQN